MAARIAVPAAIVSLFTAMASGQSTSGNPLNDFISQAAGAASVISAADSATPTPTSASSTTLSTSTTSSTPSATSSAAAETAAAQSSSSGLSQGAIIAIAVVCAIAFLVLLGFCIGCLLFRRRRRREHAAGTHASAAHEKPVGRRRGGRGGRGGCLPCLCCAGRGRKPRMDTPDSDVIDRRGWKRNSPPHGGFVDHPEALNSDYLGDGRYPPMRESTVEKDHGHHDHHPGTGHRNHHPGMGAAAGAALGAGAVGAAAHHHHSQPNDTISDGHHPPMGESAIEKDHGHHDHHAGAGTAAGAALGAGAVGAATHHHQSRRPSDADHPAFRHERDVSPANINAENPFTPQPPISRKPVPSVSPSRPPVAGASHLPARSPVRNATGHGSGTTPHGNHHGGMGTAAAAAAGGAALGAAAKHRHESQSRSRSRSVGRHSHGQYPLSSHPSHGDFHAPASSTGAVVDDAGAHESKRNRPPTPMGLSQFGTPAAATAAPERSPNRPHPKLDTAMAAGAAGAAGGALAHHHRDRSYSPIHGRHASPHSATDPDGVPAPTATQRRSLQSRDASRSSWGAADNATTPAAAAPSRSPRRMSLASGPPSAGASPIYETPLSPTGGTKRHSAFFPAAAATGAGALDTTSAPPRAAHPPNYSNPTSPTRAATHHFAPTDATRASLHDSAYVSNTDSSSGESFHSSRMTPPPPRSSSTPPPRNTAYRRSYPEHPDDVGSVRDFAVPAMPAAAGGTEEGSSRSSSPRHRYTVGGAPGNSGIYGPGALWLEGKERRGSWGSNGASGGRSSGEHGRGGSKSPRRSLGADGKPRRLRFSDVGPDQWRYDARGPVGQAM